jgi:ABC-type oligopeptide transport system substrate-binding subunit
MEKSAKTIIKDWKNLFGEKIKIELTTFDKKDAHTVAEKGEYEIAVLPLSPQNKTPQSLFDTIASAPCYYESSILNKSKAFSPIAEDRFLAYHSAEKALVENSVFVPLFYEGVTLRLAEDLQGIYIADGGEQIYFYGGHQVK